MNQKELIEIGVMFFVSFIAASIPMFFLWKWSPPKNK